MTTSARGLFRATGKSPKGRLTVGPGGKAVRRPDEREPLDFSPTPPEPTLAFCEAERGRLGAFPGLWEPACGDGRMVRDLEACGYPVLASDLVDRGCGATVRDFFDFSEPLAPAIVTNPPYNEINHRDGRGRWVWHAMDVLGVEYMALLLSWSWPGAGGHARLWERWPPARVYLCRWKIDFTGDGSPPMLNGWFVWDRAVPAGAPRLLMLDRIDARQGALGLE